MAVTLQTECSVVEFIESHPDNLLPTPHESAEMRWVDHRGQRKPVFLRKVA